MYQGGDTLNGTIVTLLFAGDMVMMAETREALLHNFEVMNAALHDQMGSNGKLKEVEGKLKEEVERDESGEKGGKECQAMIGDEQLEHVGRHNEVPRIYEQWRH